MSHLPSLYTLLLLILALSCHGQDLIKIDTPIQGQTITSKTTLGIFYTVVGVQTLSPPPVNATYPSSMNAQFQWLAKGTETNPLSFSAISGMVTRSYPAGYLNIQYTSSWNVPNCHFFSRYNPSNYDFRLVFTPVYGESDAPEQIDQQQQPIVIPLNVEVNNATFPKC
ncbi:hypothetical protein BC941DRAFT_433327 [Chlamydoabsidia padenii]|nr:hypothetical protein BC941DRAFT_433327 [Chlamydoabsidia padenii]